MNWTVYTLGDVQMFRNILNAVAMIFNNVLFAGDAGSLGGPVFLTAFFLGLMLVLAGAVKAQVSGSNQNNFAVFFLLVVFWMVGIGVKERVQVEDIYSGSVAAVDNVPIIVSVPAAIVSTFAQRMGALTQTAYSTADGSYVEMTTAGFINPLRLMIGLRNMSRQDPQTAANLQIFIKDCVLGTTPLNSFGNKNDGLSDLLSNTSYIRNGITLRFTDLTPAGQAYPCVLAQSLLRGDFENAIASTTTSLVTRVLNSNMPERAPSTTATPRVWTSDDFKTMSASMLPAAFGGLAAADDAMKNLLASAYISNVFDCGSSAFDPVSFAQCTNLAVAQDESYNIEASGAGSFFSRLMMPAMTILSAMFFALAPLVVFIAMIANFQGIGLLVKYLLFGAWTQSFLPVAHILNYFIQYQFSQAMEMLAASGANGITILNSIDVYRHAATKIALASDLMSMTPLITLMLFTGSYYALTGIAQRIGGKDVTESGQIVPQVAKMDAMASYGGAMKAMESAALKSGAANPEYSRGAALSSTIANTRSELRQSSETWAQGLSASTTNSTAGVSSRDTFTRISDQFGSGTGSKNSGSSDLTAGFVKNNSNMAGAAKAFEGAARLLAAAGVDAKIAKAGLEGVLRSGNTFSEQEQKALSSMLNDSKSFSEGWERFKKQTHSVESGTGVVKGLRESWSKDERASFDKGLGFIKQKAEALSAAENASRSSDVSMKLNAAQLAEKAQQFGMGSRISQAVRDHGVAVSDRDIRAVSGIVDPDSRRVAAEFNALYNSSNAGANAAAAGIITDLTGIGAPAADRGDLEAQRVGAPSDGIVKKVDAKTAPVIDGKKPHSIQQLKGVQAASRQPGSGLGGEAPRSRDMVDRFHEDHDRSLKAGAPAVAAQMKADFMKHLPENMHGAVTDTTSAAWDVAKGNPASSAMFGVVMAGGAAMKFGLNKEKLQSLGNKVTPMLQKGIATATEAGEAAAGFAAKHAGKVFAVARMAGPVGAAVSGAWMVYEVGSAARDAFGGKGPIGAAGNQDVDKEAVFPKGDAPRGSNSASGVITEKPGPGAPSFGPDVTKGKGFPEGEK